MSYSEKLKDPRWQRKRLEILNRDGFSCILCEDKASTLHVHHLSYVKGKEPWEYQDENFITLCEHCHCAIEWGKNNELPLFQRAIKQINIDGNVDLYLDDGFGSIIKIVMRSIDNEWVINYRWFITNKEYELLNKFFIVPIVGGANG